MTELTQIQMKLLHTVLEADGRECTETLYDIVEEARPTTDEDGEPIDDLDPYETSREEIGGLENGGYLDHDEEGMASFGYSTLTDKGREVAETLTVTTTYSLPDAAARAELAELEAELDAAGGRGVELAERIDELRADLGETL